MPMSNDLKRRLFPLISDIYRDFYPEMVENRDMFSMLRGALSPAFHVYDEKGIRRTIAEVKQAFFTKCQGTNFFAVKACPNLEILKIMIDEGFGLDCSSPTELARAKMVEAPPGRIMFTSNNTTRKAFQLAIDLEAIINVDDISLLEKLPEMPKRICFRYNPGPKRSEGSSDIIGKPEDQKYGLRDDQIVEAYKIAKEQGVEVFGIHAMYASNCLDEGVLAGNAKMLLHIARRVRDELSIELEFVNIGGGIGIDYDPDSQEPVNIHKVGEVVSQEFRKFANEVGYMPELFMESGRYITGPHGVLVGKAINKMDKYKKFVGVDFCDIADIARAPLYPAYHEVSVVDSSGKEVTSDKNKRNTENISIVGPLCENMHMVSDRELPQIQVGDFIVVQDTGAHGIAMSMKYNGWGCSQELLLKPDGTVKRISRSETVLDLIIRELNFEPKEVQYNQK